VQQRLKDRGVVLAQDVLTLAAAALLVTGSVRRNSGSVSSMSGVM
jgi:hypothetical protein